MSPTQRRIVNALKLGPLTTNEIAEAVNASPHYVWITLKALSEEGIVRRGKEATRLHKCGAAPRLWEMAA